MTENPMAELNCTATMIARVRFQEGMSDNQQAAEKGPSPALPRSRGAATYAPSTPRASDRVAPWISAFLSSLVENQLFSNVGTQR